MSRYVSAHRNEVHQLLVSLSQNYYVGADGSLRRQKKPFALTFDTMARSSKRLVVSYLLRDHYSGVYYAEMTTHNRPINLGGFLFRAWMKKAEFEFRGVPEALMVPHLVLDKWPQVVDLLNAYGVTLLKPQSGFQAGMIDVKNWQRDFFDNSFVGYTRERGVELDYGFENMKAKQLDVCVLAAGRTIDREKQTKLDKWRASDAELLVPTDQGDFEKYFAVKAQVQ